MHSALRYDPPTDPLVVLYADGAILVVDKPAGLLSVPGRDPTHSDSIATRAAAIHPGARIVHRLDMDTSGVMVLAMTAQAHRDLSRQFETRRTDKLYLALIAGRPPKEEGVVDAPLIRDWPNRPRQMVDLIAGKPALTRWRLRATHGGVSLVELVPETGRTHQLRVHMAHLGCPILGDPFYAPDEIRAAAPRLMLHASELAVAHPDTGERSNFRAKTPGGFAAWPDAASVADDQKKDDAS